MGHHLLLPIMRVSSVDRTAAALFAQTKLLLSIFVQLSASLIMTLNGQLEYVTAIHDAEMCLATAVDLCLEWLSRM